MAKRARRLNGMSKRGEKKQPDCLNTSICCIAGMRLTALICCWLSPQLALSSKGRFEAKRSPASAEPPSSGRAASLSPLYSTGPRCPV